MFGVAAATMFAGTALAVGMLALRADFDHQTVGAAPGTRGAAFGEPVSTAGAVVDVSPLSTPNLRITDPSDCCATSTWFEFLDNRELTTGTVMVRASVVFTGQGQPTLRLMEQGGFAANVFSLYTGANNTNLNVQAGGQTYVSVGVAPANEPLALAIDIAPELKKLNVKLGDQVLVNDLDYTFGSSRGVGRLLVGSMNNAVVADDVMRIDDLRVIHCDSPGFADCIFIDGHD